MLAWLPFLSAPVSLAAVALLGYMFGRRTRTQILQTELQCQRIKAEVLARKNPPAVDPPSAATTSTSDPERVLQDLSEISQRVRRSLAAHHASILRFHDRIRRFKHEPSQTDLEQLSHEAERMIQPTEQLSHQIAHAYDELRQKAKANHPVA